MGGGRLIILLQSEESDRVESLRLAYRSVSLVLTAKYCSSGIAAKTLNQGIARRYTADSPNDIVY